MYFADLTPYVYMNNEPDPRVIAVGWLDEHHAFPKGVVSETTVETILRLCFTPVNTNRGFHLSPFLPPPAQTLPGRSAGMTMP